MKKIDVVCFAFEISGKELLLYKQSYTSDRSFYSETRNAITLIELKPISISFPESQSHFFRLQV